MVISHKYKYVFVELPLTGSTAIASELREHYDGASILYKHSTYEAFQKTASEEEQRYFVFSVIRNPLDQAISHYFKFKTNHRGQFASTKRLNKLKGLNKLTYKYTYLRQFRFVQENDPAFSTFFLKFYRISYNNWSSMSHKNFNFIIRFENLSDDFVEALNLMGIKSQRPLPKRNETAQRDNDFWSYYAPETIGRAKRVFGPFMKKWNYKFPPEWGDMSIPWWHQLEFEFFDAFRRLYWKYLRRPV